MADDGAPVCNLPNIGQVPALQPGRLFSSIPRATDLPSLLQAINALAQAVAQLQARGLAPFRNNLAPTTTRSVLVGTQGINATEGADGSASRAGKDGKEGKKAKDPKYEETGRKTETVKVKNRENEDTFLIMRRVTQLTMTSSADGKAKIEWEGNVSNMSAPGVISMSRPPLPAATDSSGREHIGTLKASRDTVEEDPTMPVASVHGEGTPEEPFKPGLMADCIGVQWDSGLAVEFFE